MVAPNQTDQTQDVNQLNNNSNRHSKKAATRLLTATVISLVAGLASPALHLAADAQLSSSTGSGQPLDAPYNEQSSNSLDLETGQQQQQQQAAANQLRDQTLQLILAKLIPTIWAQPQATTSNLAAGEQGDQHNNNSDDNGSNNNISVLEQPRQQQQQHHHHHQLGSSSSSQLQLSSSQAQQQQQQQHQQQQTDARLYTAGGQTGNLAQQPLPAGHLYSHHHNHHQTPNEQFQPQVVVAANQQQQQQQLQSLAGQLMTAETANSQSPVRQLISPQANNLYYPPGEAPSLSTGAGSGQQPPSAAGPQQPYPLSYQPQLPVPNYANLHSQLPIQMPPMPAPQSQYRPPPSWPQFTPIQQQPIVPPQFAGPQQQLFARPFALYPQALGSLTSILPQQQQQQAQLTTQNAATSAGPSGSALLSFLANNRANLANMIQLLPVVAQAFATIPKILAPQSGNRSSPSAAASAIADKLAERIHQSATTDTPSSSKLTASSLTGSSSLENRWPSWLSAAVSGSGGAASQNLAPALITSLLPQLTRHFLSSSSSTNSPPVSSASHLSASPPYEFVSSLQQQSPTYSLLGLQASNNNDQLAGSSAGNLMRDLIGAWMSSVSRRTMSRDPSGWESQQQQSQPSLSSLSSQGTKWLSHWLQNQRRQELASGPRSMHHLTQATTSMPKSTLYRQTTTTSRPSTTTTTVRPKPRLPPAKITSDRSHLKFLLSRGGGGDDNDLSNKI